MNDQTGSELKWLKDRQSLLEKDVAILRRELDAIERRLQNTSMPAAALPPIISSMPVAGPPGVQGVARLPSLGRASQTKAVSIPLSEAKPDAPPAPLISTVQATAAASKATPKETSLEMRVGTFWLVRVGIVMVLTALVFFGNLAYHNFIGRMGAGGKVGFLYLASFGLLACGAFWLRRNSRESLRNYAQVVFAGGLAAVYFTTFAAHHFPNLRVIGSPLLDGALLLAWAGFIVWMADRKQSEVLALFAILLAYYTSVITRVGYFTLYSNLLLTAAAVFFLVRNRWSLLSFASLVATYSSYAFWRFFQDGQWGYGAWVLMAYWGLFTTAVFLSRGEDLAGAKRASFLTFNNGAFLALFLLTMAPVREEGLWRILLGFGTVLIGLSAVAKKALKGESQARNGYLAQGLVLVTLGFITKLSGMKLALLLGGESVILLLLAHQRGSRVLFAGAYASAALATAWAMDGFTRYDHRSMYLGIGLGALMLVNSVLTSRRKGRKDSDRQNPAAAYFGGLAVLLFGLATWHNTKPEFIAIALALEALVFTLSIYVLRVREIAVLAQALMVAALLSWMEHRLIGGTTAPWWTTAGLIGATLALSHWWQRQALSGRPPSLPLVVQYLYALGMVVVTFWWLVPNHPSQAVLVPVSVLMLGLTAYGAFTKLWSLAGFAQLLLIPLVGLFALLSANSQAEWYQSATPIAVLMVMSIGANAWLSLNQEIPGQSINITKQLSLTYRWVALGMSLWWIQTHIAPAYRLGASMGLAMAAFGFAGWRPSRELLMASGVYGVFALAQFWIPPAGSHPVSAINLLAILAVVGLQRAARVWSEIYRLDSRVHTLALLGAGMSLWLFVSRWALDTQTGFYLTASWSALALVIFLLGFISQEKVYRWLGLGILACALGRVVMFDVWKLETLYRILSFLALGIVLLVLGYMYSRFQDKIRRWL